MRKAFSLLDAIFGLAILSAGILGVMVIFQDSISSNALADQTITATHLGQETLERIRAQRDCNLAGCGYSNTLNSINTNVYNQNSAYTITASAYEVDPDSDGGTDDFLDAQAGSGYARVTVTVSWNGGTKSLSLVTLISNYTPP